MRPGDSWSTGEHNRRITDAAAVEAMRNMTKFTWQKTRVFWPRRCRISKKAMWPGAAAYKGTRVISGPCEGLVLTRWISPEAYLFEKIKGNI